MIKRCRRRLIQSVQVEVRSCRLEELQTEAASWDLILLFRVFPHFDDKVKVLRMLRTWVKPKGRLVIANLEGSERLNELHASFSEAVRHDHMPCRYGTSRLLEENGWRVHEARDEPDEFFVASTPI